MSRLDDLIKEYCPDGVEYKPLLSIAEVLYGYPCDASLFNETKAGLPLARIRDVISGTSETYTTETVPSKYRLSKGDLLIGMDGNFHVSQWKQDGAILCQRVCKLFSRNEDTLSNGFLVHLMKPVILKIENEKQSGTVKHLLDKDIKAIMIPVPPIKVQREIVRILDDYTAKTEELKEKLSAELSARKKQYEYYRDAVLAIDSSVPRVELGSTAKVTKLAGFEFTNYVKYSSSGNIIALRGLNVKEGRLVLDDVKYIDNSDLPKLERSKLVIGDMLFTYVGTVGQVAIIDENDRYYLAPNVALIRADNSLVNPKYLIYYFQSTEFKRMQIDRLLQSSSMKNIPMEKIRKFMIPVPSLEKQNEIVNLLERFDTLCNDISSGLPAEIEARQKQYEYYRDKLLTFKEKTA